MINARGQYLYVSGADFDATLVNGEVMPLRDAVRDPAHPLRWQNALRGEDPAFLIEAVAERQMALDGQVDVNLPAYSKEIDGKIKRCNDWMAYATGMGRPQSRHFISPSLAIANRETTDALDAQGNRYLKPYRDNYPDVSDADYYAAALADPGAFDAFAKSQVLAAFANTQKLTRCFRPCNAPGGHVVGMDLPYTDYTWRNGQLVDATDGTERAGDNDAGEFLVRAFRADAQTSGYVADGTTWSWLVHYGSLPSNGSTAVGMTATGLPPGCACRPVIGWRFAQEYADTRYLGPETVSPTYYYKYTRYGYGNVVDGENQSLFKTAGALASNTLTWTWNELKRLAPSFSSASYYVNVTPGRYPQWPEDFVTPGGTQVHAYVQRNHYDQWIWPVGVIVDLGDHTRIITE